MLNKKQIKLEQLLRFDALTGFANRHRFDEFLKTEWKRAIGVNACLAMIMMGIDSFKPFSDLYGQLEADECLKRVALAIDKSFEHSADMVARYGGEVFSVVISDTINAMELAEQCRRNVEDLKIPHGCSAASDVMTISCGVAIVKVGSNVFPVDLLNNSNWALYTARDAGCNRTHAF